MKNVLIVAGLFSFVVACSGSSGTEPVLGQVGGEVRLEVSCKADTDCPSGYECESETEAAVTKSFCASHGGAKAPESLNGEPLECETEVEHGVSTTTCKPHGGSDATEDATDDDGASSDDPAGHDVGDDHGDAGATTDASTPADDHGGQHGKGKDDGSGHT